MFAIRRQLYGSDTVKTEILHTPIKHLDLKLRHSILETCINKAMEDIQYFGVELEPNFYLSDGYGCVEATTNIGLAFWDADKVIREILRETKDIYRDEQTILNLIKHEVGHAFCYAHKLYRLKKFRKVFNVQGNFFRTYPKNHRYHWDPWSPDFVNPDGEYYAQKHPDDDFAETFSTIVDPQERWRELYFGRIGVLKKIDFVYELIALYGKKQVSQEKWKSKLHVPVDDIEQTLAEFFSINPNRYAVNATGFMDPDLKAIFPTSRRARKPTLPAHQLLHRHRQFLKNVVAEQAQVKNARFVKEIITKVLDRLKNLELVYREDEEDKVLLTLTSYIMLKSVIFKIFGILRLPQF